MTFGIKPSKSVVNKVGVNQKLEKEIKELFDEIDKDKSGYVDKNELYETILSLGINPGGEELDKYFEMFDVDKNG